MQRRFKGVLCCAENVSFPATVVYEGMEYPVVATTDATGGEYLLAFLDTAGDPVSVVPVNIKPSQIGNALTQSKHGRIGSNEPIVRMTFLRTDHSLRVPAYLDPKSMRLAGMHLRTTEGTVYVPLKRSPYNKFQRSLHTHGYVMATNQCVESEMGSIFNIQLHATIDASRTLVVKGMPVNITGVVFEGDIDYSPSLYKGIAAVPTEIALLNLDTNNYEEVGSLFTYNGRQYAIKSQSSTVPTLVIAFDGHPRNSNAVFAMVSTEKADTVISTDHLEKYSFKE